MSHSESGFIFNAEEDSFQSLVIERSFEVPVLVDFWADWCPPCKALNPVLEKAVDEFSGSVVMASVDTDENMRLAGRYKLTGFPSVLLFIDGEEKGRFTGARNLKFVLNFIRCTLQGVPFTDGESDAFS